MPVSTKPEVKRLQHGHGKPVLPYGRPKHGPGSTQQGIIFLSDARIYWAEGKLGAFRVSNRILQIIIES